MFHVDGIGGQRVLVPHLILERVQTEEKPDGKSRTGPQPGAGGQVGNVMDLDSLVDFQELKTCANRRMFDCSVATHVFYF